MFDVQNKWSSVNGSTVTFDLFLRWATQGPLGPLVCFTSGDKSYVCTLDEASKRKCKEELNERNPTDTLLAVQTFRQWVKEQDWLRTPTGTN